MPTASEKRRQLRAGLAAREFLRFVGAPSPLAAMMIERAGFEGVYVSGAAVAADLGLPDIGLTTLDEVVTRGHQIARVTELPAIIDIDTGFGDLGNLERTVREVEDAGLAGLHLEDQRSPKRCGHLDGKAVVSCAEMQSRVRVAVGARRDADLLIIARTDARAVEGLEAALERASAYVEAGADAVFVEALPTLEEFRLARGGIDVPLVANMTEFGKSDLHNTHELRGVGINIVLYPVTLLRLANHAIFSGLESLAHHGTQQGLLTEMQTREQLYELLGYDPSQAPRGGSC